ncbi:hypothetical protein ANN_27730 [Periplaneta americana]|uniref:Uncharacterized protein n=1 Tax=Periplaneta americana TaxID=6978 RepID=A0ABQ8RV41_PERAM|nr:hypothetical protein ANN_27730 [Periplaneta americana]
MTKITGRQECRATEITQVIGEITILKESIHSHASNQEKVIAELVAQRMKRIATEHPEISLHKFFVQNFQKMNREL